MDWLVVVALVSCGCLLIVVEVAIIPGTTITGIGGVVLLLSGVIFGFYHLSWQGSWMVLGITLLVLTGGLYFLFKKQTWKKMALQATSLGHLNKPDVEALTIGLQGVTTSSLRPSGHAEILDKRYEVRTFGEFISTGKQIEIVQIESGLIVVKSI